MARRLDADGAGFAAQFDALLNAKREIEEDVAAASRAIIADVRTRGDAALIELGQKFDSVELSEKTLRLTGNDLVLAEAACTKAQLKALDVEPITADSFPRTSGSSMPRASSLAGAGRLWKAWAFMFPAARRPIRAPS
jgi:histidinol dehydrogenase